MPKLPTQALPLVLLAALALGCGGPTNEPDAARIDAAARSDDAAAGGDDAGAALDAPALDAGASLDAASTLDAAYDPILGISGSCGTLDTELTDELDHAIENTSTFPEGFHGTEGPRLSTGAQTILAEGTAGGSSGYSEAFAFEVLHRCEGAELVASETMILYTPMPGSIADMLVEIDGVRVGVSVTRAVTVTGMCMRADTYTLAAASTLLTRKVQDIHEARTFALPVHAWTKDMVFVFADTAEHARVMREAWDMLDASVRADTILYVSVSEDMDAFVYFQDACM